MGRWSFPLASHCELFSVHKGEWISAGQPPSTLGILRRRLTGSLWSICVSYKRKDSCLTFSIDYLCNNPPFCSTLVQFLFFLLFIVLQIKYLGQNILTTSHCVLTPYSNDCDIICVKYDFQGELHPSAIIIHLPGWPSVCVWVSSCRKVLSTESGALETKDNQFMLGASASCCYTMPWQCWRVVVSVERRDCAITVAMGN